MMSRDLKARPRDKILRKPYIRSLAKKQIYLPGFAVISLGVQVLSVQQ